MKASDLIAPAAIGLIGYLAIKKVTELGDSAGQAVTNAVTQAEQKYSQFVADTKTAVSDTVSNTVSDVKTAATTAAEVAAYSNPVTAPFALGADALSWLKDYFANNKGSGGTSNTAGSGSTSQSSGTSQTSDYGASALGKTATGSSLYGGLTAAMGEAVAAGKTGQTSSGSSSSSGSKYSTVVAAVKSSKGTNTSSDGVSSIKRQGKNGTGESKVKIIKKKT